MLSLRPRVVVLTTAQEAVVLAEVDTAADVVHAVSAGVDAVDVRPGVC
jgi:hypothetical protein